MFSSMHISPALLATAALIGITIVSRPFNLMLLTSSSNALG
jgi:hypothetical protein